MAGRRQQNHTFILGHCSKPCSEATVMRVFHLIIFLAVLSSSCKPSIDNLLEDANSYMQRGEYTKAIQLYSSVLLKNDSNELAYFSRSLAFYQLDSNEAALRDINTILSRKTDIIEFSVNPKYASASEQYRVSYEEALYQRGLIWQNMDSMRKAFIDFKKCLDMETDKEQKADLCIRIGDIYISASSKKEKGCEYYRLALIYGSSLANERLDTYCK
jgi:tetratricopeptide (TPR) repeat protein